MILSQRKEIAGEFNEKIVNYGTVIPMIITFRDALQNAYKIILCHCDTDYCNSANSPYERYFKNPFILAAMTIVTTFLPVYGVKRSQGIPFFIFSSLFLLKFPQFL